MVFRLRGRAGSLWATCAGVLLCFTAAQELLLNSDFEQAFTGDDWTVWCGDLAQDTEAYTGMYSAHVTGRSQICSLSQSVPFSPNTRYSLSAMVKLENLPQDGALWVRGQLLIVIEYADDTTDYHGIGSSPYLRPELGWQKLRGDYYLDDRAVNRVQVSIEIQDASVDFKADSASLKVIERDPDWRQKAEETIAEIRTNDININLRIGEDFDPSRISVEIDQLSHSFPFGSAIVDRYIVDTDAYSRRYQDCFYSNFNWAVQENELKWNNMEEEWGLIDFPDDAINILNEKGVLTRGHLVFWGKEEHVPAWMLGASEEYIRSEITRRIEYLVPRYQGKLVHWDVNNEQEHGPWYEENTGDPDIMAAMFQQVRAHDPEGLLFINDYGMVTYSQSAQAMVNTAERLTALGCDVGGIGAQSHWGSIPDIDAVRDRLDILESGGYPVWITELDISLGDVNERAQALDDLVTLYFSRPGVHGILLWGFSGNHGPCRETCSLFDGDDFTPNAAGERWIEMLTSRWHTAETFTTNSTEATFTTRGFYGQYSLLVYDGSSVVRNETFILPPDSAATVFIELC